MKRKVDTDTDITSSSDSDRASSTDHEREYNEVVEQLVSIFKFASSTARQAVDAVGTDLTAAYNWIFDQALAEDKGGPIIPKDNCPHIRKHAVITAHDLKLDQPCSFLDDEDNRKGDIDRCLSHENWICLECNATRCSRYVSGHCRNHWLYTREKAGETKGKELDCVGHCIAVSISDLSVWCYECDAYIRHPLLKPITERLEFLKFGNYTNEVSSNE